MNEFGVFGKIAFHSACGILLWWMRCKLYKDTYVSKMTKFWLYAILGPIIGHIVVRIMNGVNQVNARKKYGTDTLEEDADILGDDYKGGIK